MTPVAKPGVTKMVSRKFLISTTVVVIACGGSINGRAQTEI